MPVFEHHISLAQRVAGTVKHHRQYISFEPLCKKKRSFMETFHIAVRRAGTFGKDHNRIALLHFFAHFCNTCFRTFRYGKIICHTDHRTRDWR